MKGNKTIAVLGLGLFGVSVAKTLAKNNIEVIAMDKNMDHVEEVSEYVVNAVQGDFTKLDNLEAALVNTADIAIVATGELLEATIMAIFHLKKLDVPQIIVKTKNLMYREVLLKVGANRVLLPEVEIGIELGSELSEARVQDLLELDDDYHIIEIDALNDWIGKRLSEMNLVKDYKLNVFGVRGKDDLKYNFLVESDYIFSKGDRVIVLSGNEKINREALGLESLAEWVI